MESNKILKKLEELSSMWPPPSYHFEHKNESIISMQLEHYLQNFGDKINLIEFQKFEHTK